MAHSPFARVWAIRRLVDPGQTADRGGLWHGGGQAGVIAPSMQTVWSMKDLAAGPGV
jgi:hypothetical protein